ncbi:hypothetical protein VL10_24135 [Leclercia adecarboxylata]|nr:hypothetical protein VL10_24135 [Leclercia adecarboxylata]KMN66762.1 hypothetical protein VK95_04575 [Leclercia sp. LK8]
MSWRQHDDVLLVCHIQALPGRKGLESAVTSLVRLWREILDQVSEINEIRGMIGRYGSPEEQRRREKMLAIFLQQGGVISDDSSPDRWLVLRR